MFDRSYDKVIILCYPQGGGGKFLVNCLSLNDQCVLSNASLAAHQLDNGGFTPAEKLSYFHEQLDRTLDDGNWDDLGLGNEKLFDVPTMIYFNEYPEIICRKWNTIISRVVDQHKYLFIVAHTTHVVDACLKFWTNARVIFFKDTDAFIRQRGYYHRFHDVIALRDYWNKIRGEDWPVDPPLERNDFLQLPDWIRAELLDTHQGEIFRWVEITADRNALHHQSVNERVKELGKDRAYEWSVAKNFSGDHAELIANLNRCADWVGVTIDVAESDIVAYYQKWLTTIFSEKIIPPV